MAKAFGIVKSASTNIWVEGLEDYRTIGALSFLGRFRIVDFPISNLTNSGIDNIQVYITRKPRSLTEHLGTGRHYGINSKRGKLQILFPESKSDRDIYNTDIQSLAENKEAIERMNYEYVVITPNHMIYTANFDELLDKHIASGADITLLYHAVDTAKEKYINCNTLELNRQGGVLSIRPNLGAEAEQKIFMETYIMKKELLLELIQRALKTSSVYTLADITNEACDHIDVRAIEHEGYFEAITSFKSYYDVSMSLIDFDACGLFNSAWPILTRTNDSSPTQYYDGAAVKSSLIANGCKIEGTVENSIISRKVTIGKGAVIKNCVILPENVIGENVVLENVVVDKHSKIIHENKIIGSAEAPAYVKRRDVL